jgi:hypothetical protein
MSKSETNSKSEIQMPQTLSFLLLVTLSAAKGLGSTLKEILRCAQNDRLMPCLTLFNPEPTATVIAAPSPLAPG